MGGGGIPVYVGASINQHYHIPVAVETFWQYQCYSFPSKGLHCQRVTPKWTPESTCILRYHYPSYSFSSFNHPILRSELSYYIDKSTFGGIKEWLFIFFRLCSGILYDASDYETTMEINATSTALPTTYISDLTSRSWQLVGRHQYSVLGKPYLVWKTCHSCLIRDPTVIWSIRQINQ